jgi:hypothetical protein
MIFFPFSMRISAIPNFRFLSLSFEEYLIAKVNSIKAR